VYLAITAILEVYGQWWGVFPRYIANPKLGDHFGRARGPLLDSVAFGFTMTACLLAACAWRPRLGRPAQLLIFGLVGLMLVAVYFSYTRSVWMGTAAGLIVVLALTSQGAWRPLVLGTILLAVLLGAATRFESLVAFKREHSAEGTRDSATLRPVIGYVSWKMFLDHPLLGSGFGQYFQAKNYYLDDRDTELALERARDFQHHNLFLALLVDTGLVGLGLYLGILALWTRDAWRLWMSEATPLWARPQSLICLGLLAAYVPNALFHDVSHTNYVQLLLFFVAGVTAGLVPLAGAATVARTPIRSGALRGIFRRPLPQVSN
jgi:O-antigen ligase